MNLGELCSKTGRGSRVPGSGQCRPRWAGSSRILTRHGWLVDLCFLLHKDAPWERLSSAALGPVSMDVSANKRLMVRNIRTKAQSNGRSRRSPQHTAYSSTRWCCYCALLSALHSAFGGGRLVFHATVLTSFERLGGYPCLNRKTLCSQTNNSGGQTAGGRRWPWVPALPCSSSQC
jgi:hypothetical protein